MGICCSRPDGATGIDRPVSTKQNYNPDAPLVPDASGTIEEVAKLNLKFILATKNNGWACAGHSELKGGCRTGCGLSFKSYNIKAYFLINDEVELVFCTDCL